MDPVGLIIALVLLLVLSAFFSASESAMLSAETHRLRAFAADDDDARRARRATQVLKLKEKEDSVLASILIGNNIVNILSTALATTLFVGFVGDWGVTLSTIVMTVLVLILGEIGPKNLAKASPEMFCMKTEGILRFFLFILYPLNLLFRPVYLLTNRVGERLEDEEESDSGEEIKAFLEEATEEGDIEESTSNMMQSMVDLETTTAQDILTQRVNMVAIDDEMSADEVEKLFIESGFSRLPVFHETIDDITGILLQKDFFALLAEDRTDYQNILTEPMYVYEQTKTDDLLKKFLKAHQHLALVTDENGGIEGLVTFEDVLEELVGEIWDEHDRVEEDIVRRKDGSLMVQGDCLLEELFELLELPSPEEEFESNTIGGWMMENLECVPEKGACVSYEGFNFRVISVGGHAVRKVLITKTI